MAKPSLQQAGPGSSSDRSTTGALLVLVAGSAALVSGVTLFSLWRAPGLFRQIVHICQAGWAAWAEHLPAATDLLILNILVIGLLRGTASLVRQWWLTHRHLRWLEALSRPLPGQLAGWAKRMGIGRRIVFIASGQPFAFCGGLWRPRVWVSAGLLAYLDDSEMIAVLRHEAHHLRRRDPLRLLVVRALCDAFFFLPLARDLRWWYEIEQETRADRAAGDVLPLASALHKLLTSGARQTAPDTLALSGLSVTEARIRQLVQPGSQPSMTWLQPSVLVSLAAVVTMLGLTLTPPWLSTPHLYLGAETCDAGGWISLPATLIR